MNNLAYDLNSPDIYNPEPKIIKVAEPLFECGYRNGIYFNMPDSEYHQIPALSSSGIRNLLISPMDFWARSWMNPEKVDEPTDAMDLGKAYHKRILEGKEAFYKNYAPAFDKTAYPDALDTNDEMKEALKGLGLKVAGNKCDLIERLREADPSIQILQDIRQEYESDFEGMEFLNPETIRRIEISAAMIERHPDLGKAFQGGYPEVSVIWHDVETGLPMKARFDYLRLKAIIDLKTFSNTLGKPIDRAIYSAMASGKYHIQAATYIEADNKAIEFARLGQVFIGGTDFINVEPSGQLQEWIDAYAKITDRTFMFVFQQTGIAPVARGKVFPRHLVYECGLTSMRTAIDKFVECYRKFGIDPWIDTTPIDEMQDDEFPIWTTDV